MKRIIFILIINFIVLTIKATTVVSWSLPSSGYHKTYQESKTFIASKGDVIECKSKVSLSAGSKLSVKVDGVELYNEQSYMFSEDGTYEVSYEYFRAGGGSAYGGDIYITLTPAEEFRLEEGSQIVVDYFRYLYNGQSLSLTKTYKNTSDIIVPDNVSFKENSYKVTSIENSVFYRKTSLNSVTIPNTVTKIGEDLFAGCTSLKKVVLPANIEEIPNSCFLYCSNLTDINILGNVNRIGSRAFEGCSNLTAIELGGNINIIDQWAFSGCTKLKSVSNLKSVSIINSEAFSNCTSLSDVEFGTKLKIIGNKAFFNCNSLSTVSLPINIETIGDYAFDGCSGITSVALAREYQNLNLIFEEDYDQLTKVKTLTFLEGCEKTFPTKFRHITELSLPHSLVEISDESFQSFTKLSHVDIPYSVKRIGEYSFSYCKLSGELVIPNSVKYIGQGAFNNSQINSLKIGNDVEIINNGAFRDCQKLKTITFGDKLQKICESAFEGCISLETLNFPASLRTIDPWAFQLCKKIKHIQFNKGLQVIDKYAFYHCDSISILRIPNTVITIGQGAFEHNDKGLDYSLVEIGNGVKELRWVFGQYPPLPTVNRCIIGNGINSIADYECIFGSTSYAHHSQVFLLTNNTVSFGFGGGGYDTPNCDIFVPDSTKYSDDIIKLYGIRNIIQTQIYNGEYIGKLPDIIVNNNLNDYKIEIDSIGKDVGSYNRIKVTYSKDDFLSAIYVPCYYTITKAPLTITPYDISITYGEDIPNLPCVYQGLKNNETSDYALAKTPNVTTLATKESDAGKYTLYASGAEAKNYEISYKTGTLTILPAKQEITWKQTFNNVYIDSKIELNATSSCGLKVQYASSNPSIAHISEEDGKVYLIFTQAGTVSVTASQKGNTNYETAENVSKSITSIQRYATGITLNKTNATIIIGETLTLTATVTPSTTINKNVIWSSSNETIATVDNGIVKSVGVGEVIISATTADGSGIIATCKITVKPILATSIMIDKASVSLNIGETASLIATILPNDATYKNIEWSTSNKDFATVENGIVRAIKPGNVVITAKTTDGSSLTATTNVIVQQIPVSSIVLNKTAIQLYVNDKEQLKATLSPSNATYTDLVWITTNTSVAIVENGIITAKSAGIATITATTTDGSNISASCKVTVKKHPQSIVWEQNLDGLAVGGSVIEVNAKTSSGLPVSYYSSADERIVNFVSINGKLYLNPMSQGTTTVTARFTGNNYYADAELTRTVTVKEGQKSTITFDSNGGSGVMAITALCGAQIDCPQSPECDGYTFMGWKPAFPATMPYEDMTLTAQWKPKKYKVTFMADGNVMQENTLDYGTEIILPTNEPKKTGYSFIGWEPAVDATVPSHDVTYNAVFKRESHKITFDTDGGSVVEVIEGPYDSEYAQPQLPVKTGYSFAGWQPSIPERIPAVDMSVKALWKLNCPLADRNETEVDYAGYTVSLISGASDTKMYYSTDDSEPTSASTLYTTPIIINNDVTIKAIAIDQNNSKSEVARFAFSVIKMPKIQIGEGWNWVTINANGKQSAISDVLSVGEWALGDEVKNDSKSISFSEDKKKWYGTLGAGTFDNNKMYKIHSAKNQTLTTNINAMNPEKVEISVMPGWNYIAYPLTTTEMLAETLANYDAEDGDIIKSQEQFSVYNAKTATWQGELKTLTPGRGYMIKRKEGARNAKFRFMANTGVMENEETVRSSKYANNMNLIATISGLPIENGDSIVAVCNNEIRGCASIQTDSKAYLTIQGNKNDIVTMRLMRNGNVVAYANNSIQYADDTVVGTVDNPTSIKFNKYDNSIGTITAIYDTNGRIMKITDIDALSPGTYLIHSILKGGSKITKINKR